MKKAQKTIAILKAIKKDAGVSTEVMAAKMGFSQATLARWFSGQTKRPNLSSMRLAMMFILKYNEVKANGTVEEFFTF